jgi:hypothetical protein
MFLAQKYTIWSYDPRRVRRLSDKKMSQIWLEIGKMRLF